MQGEVAQGASADAQVAQQTDATVVPTKRHAALGAIARAARLGVVTAVCGAGGLWAADALVLSRQGAEIGWGHLVVGLGASLLVSVTAAIFAGAATGPFLVPVVDRIAERVRAVRLELKEGDEEAQRRVAAGVTGTVGLLAVSAWPIYRASLAIVLGLARPESMALVLVVTHLAYVALLLAMWPSAVRLARLVVDAMSRIRFAKWLTHRASRLLFVLVLVAAAGAGAAIVSYRQVLSELQWHEVQSLPGLGLGLAFGALVLAGASARAKRIAMVVGGIAIVLGAVAVSRLRPEGSATRRLAFEQALGGHLGYSAWSAALDFDRDGQINVFGGADCAPFDPTRHAGAIDVPGNGIDEDCDGKDLKPAVIAPRSRLDVGQRRLPLRPDVVLITIDGLAARHLAVLGGPHNTMPHVDALAAKGALFSSCFSEGPSTRLSFPSMFTSKYDSELNFAFASRPPYSVKPTERQLQEWLSESGYEADAVIPHSYFDPAKWPGVTHGFHRVDSSPILGGKNNAPQVTAEALSILSQEREDPLYLWVHYYDAHAPYKAPEGSGKEGAPDEEVYDAELTFIDGELGKLLAAIEARNQATYVVLTADHGTAFHPHASLRHARYGYDLYTATLHVPLIVAGPSIEPSRVDTLASTMDVGPTIADLLRLPEPRGAEGTSLAPEVLAKRRDLGRVVFSEYFLGERDYEGKDPLEIVAARRANLNLILDRVHGVFELYDWSRDYWEEDDRYEVDASSPEVVELRGSLATFLQQFDKRPPGLAVAQPPK